MNLDRTVNKLLIPNELSLESVQQALHDLCKYDIEYGEIYFQSICSESWSIEESIVKKGGYSISQGMGVRAIVGEKTGFAYSDEISPTALRQTVKAAGGIARKGGSGRARILTEKSVKQLYLPLNPLESIEREQKIKILQEMDRYARNKCPQITQFNATISGTYENVLITASDGTLAGDIRPMIRISCSVVVKKGDRIEGGTAGGGGRCGYEFFFDTVGTVSRFISYVDEAIRIAMVNLESKAAPAGVFPVVLSAGWSGVLIHEAVGHGLEGDTCRKGESVYSKLIGEQVASELCTIVDDGTIARARGSLSIDDEGEPSRYNVLIENGKLKSFMYDKHSAHLAGKVSTGNGRRDSYSSTPQTRMTNTYMLPGTSEEAEMIESVKKGIYAVSLGGGQVDVTSGKFVFSVNEAYEINNGKVGHPLKGITLIGDAIGVMKKVSMVGNNLKFDGGVGSCGKGGQWVPVGLGIPSVKGDEITIGGTK